MATPPPPVNLRVILSESKRIINAHSRHFLALSVLFLLPNSFSATVFPSVFRLVTDQSAASHNSVSLLRGFRDGDDQPPRADPDYKTMILFPVAYMVVSTVWNLLAIGSIAYSVFQGFYGRPVKLISAVKSSFASFFPLLATLISITFIFLGIIWIIGFAAFLLKMLIEIIIPGLEIGILALFVIVMIISIVIVTKLSVDWILAWAIVVVESAWGLTPLKRSKSLTKGMKRVSLSIIFFFGVTQSALAWISKAAASAQIFDNGETGELWTNAFFVLQIVITSAILTFLSLYNLSAFTVMYMYCKAVNGELAWEIADEFVREYVSVPFDDGKGPHLISVAYNNV